MASIRKLEPSILSDVWNRLPRTTLRLDARIKKNDLRVLAKLGGLVEPRRLLIEDYPVMGEIMMVYGALHLLQLPAASLARTNQYNRRLVVIVGGW